MTIPTSSPGIQKLHVLALANTFALIDLVLHPLFHLWGWLWPRGYEAAMGEFVIGLQLQVDEHFGPAFVLFWMLEAVTMWLLGASAAFLYNRLVRTN